ncbi:MAG TPA: pitrilysin family protein [Myxococcota bacterium]
MRLIARSVLVFAGLACALSASAASDAAGAKPIDDPALRTQIATLANGLTLLTLEDHATPTVSLQVWVRVGSGDESRFTGIAHLFEHMMFLSSKNLGKLGPEAYARIVEARGGRINAYTSRDVTVYFEDVAPEHLPLMIALEGERFANLEVNEEALTAERQVVMEERRLRNENDPDGLAFEALMGLTYQAHPYRVPTVGWQSDLEKVTAADCQAFWDTYYAANNLVVSIAGDFDGAEARALVDKHFGSLRSAASIPRNPQEEPDQDGERRAVEHAPVRAPIVIAGFPAPATGHVDADALDVAAGVLGSGRTSRLYRAMVFDAPLALAPQAFYWELQRAGIFVAGATLRPGVDVPRAEAVIFSEIARLAQTPPNAEELKRAKRGLEVAWISGQGTAHALASRIAQDYVAYGRIETLEEKLAAIERVTPEDVQRVVRQYLAPNKRSIVQVFPRVREEGRP